jgi:GDP-4-dehydro-6-deoxy-D-mannose reductase
VRSFNIIGPGQPPSLACSSFARQIALAELHGDNSITTGDLSAQRDFVDVRDVARAYEMTALHGRVGQVYNVSSRRTVSIRECLDELLKLTPQPFQIISNVQQAQKMDVSIQLGSAERLRKHSGWQPRISLQSSLADLLDYWRRMVQSEIGTRSD